MTDLTYILLIAAFVILAILCRKYTHTCKWRHVKNWKIDKILYFRGGHYEIKQNLADGYICNKCDDKVVRYKQGCRHSVPQHILDEINQWEQGI